jgi:sugar/nucleoside kinase (ribokinase family)
VRPASPVVLVCGHVTLDRRGEALVPGGSAYYAARALAALGARPRVVTAAGDDFPRDALAGIEVAWVPAPATTRFVNVHGPDGRRTQRVEATAPPLAPGDVPAAWREADALLLVPVLAETPLPAFARAARAPVTLLGLQGLVRTVAEDGRVTQPPWAFAAGALAGLSAVVLGEDEVRGQGDLVERLRAAVPLVAFTHGADGSELFTARAARRVGVHPAREVDPTGAGDVFAAGLLLGLARGETPEEAARLGAAAASVVVEGVGGETLGRTGEAWARRERVPVDGG